MTYPHHRTEMEIENLREILRLDREVGPAQTTEDGRREITRQIANLGIMVARDAEAHSELWRAGDPNQAPTGG